MTQQTDDLPADASRAFHFSPWLLGVYFERYSHPALCLYCCFACLSIAASQILLIPLILSWLFFVFDPSRTASTPASAAPDRSTSPMVLAAPIATWIGISFLASIIGVDPLQAFSELIKTVIYVLLPFCVYTSFRIYQASDRQKLERVVLYLFLLVCSQSAAAAHTMLENVFGSTYLLKIPGGLTESGQLVLIFPIVIMLTALALRSRQDQEETRQFSFGPLFTTSRLAVNAAAACLLMLIAWPNALAFASASAVRSVCAALLAALLFWTYRSQPLKLPQVSIGALKGLDRWLQLAAMLLLSALVLNLKRGPWMGIALELVVLGAFLSKRLLAITFVGGCLVLLFFDPVQDRLMQMGEHFNIVGGRRYMWSLGAELVQRYPLGVGPDNAQYMQIIDPTLPEPHQHMHNNLLNVLVETGWLGLAAYLWWIFASIKIGMLLFLNRFRSADYVQRTSGLLALALGTSVLGWQTAGLVEYNFGDGEIRLMGLLAMGLLLALGSLGQQAEEHSPAS